MAIFNASYTVGEFYKQTVSGLCGSTTYEFAAWMANILTSIACGSAGIDPNLTFRIESLSWCVIGFLQYRKYYRIEHFDMEAVRFCLYDSSQPNAGNFKNH
jgi:hypothetical protein